LSIESPSKFSLTDKEFEEFVKWASGRDFDYRTASEVEFDKMVSTLKRESIYDVMKDEIALLEKKLKLGKTDVLKRAVNEIKPLLEEEIVSRYYFQRGRIESMLRNDIQAAKAIDVKLIE